MENLETIAKKLAEISANYTFGVKTLDEIITEFNLNSDLKIQFLNILLNIQNNLKTKNHGKIRKK